MNRRIYPLIVAGLFISACATSARIVDLGPVGAPLEESPYAGEDIYLKSFIVKNKGSKDTVASEEKLRQTFIEYLEKHGKFKKVHDITKSGEKAPPGAYAMNLDIQIQLQDNNFTFMKSYYGTFLLWSVYPRKGSATVIGNAQVTRGTRTISSKSWTSTKNYSYVFYGGVRTSPIITAFRECYEDVFSHLAIPMKLEGGPGVSQADLESMVKASVDRAAKKEVKVYHSDVDTPKYKHEENSDAYAMIVGIEKYQSIPNADFAERDAQTMREHLLALGFPQRNIVQLTGNMATKSNLEKYLEHWLPEKVKEDSKVFFYFSGHGAPDIDSKEAFIVPWDGDVKYLRQSGYPIKRLYRSLKDLKAQQVMVALDSCFSGAGGRSVLPKGARPLVMKVDETLETGKLVILTASEGNEISLSDDKQGHGLFTYNLLKGLNEKEGRGTVRSLYNYLVPRVQDGARQQNRDQTPQLISAEQNLSEIRLTR